jgi:hypothetical protein
MFLVDRMAESDKIIQEALSRLTSQLESIEKKVGNNAVDLGKVQFGYDVHQSGTGGVGAGGKAVEGRVGVSSRHGGHESHGCSTNPGVIFISGHEHLCLRHLHF